MNYSELVGKKHIFEDGNVIEVIQIKDRDSGLDEVGVVPFVTYTTYQHTSLPRKLVMQMKEFIESYGHLFGYTNEYNQPD
jgi:hypothetical protein